MGNSKRKIRIGDRFRWDNKSTWEVISIVDNYCVQLMCITSIPNFHPVGNITRNYSIVALLYEAHSFWTYIGNYGKQDNFIELYNLFNEDNS